MDSTSSIKPHYPIPQLFLLCIFRIAIGWHFLYEGIAKLLDPEWSALGYLQVSRWWFTDFFQWLGSNSILLTIVDCLVIWGLIMIGLALILGFLNKTFSFCGILLLSFFYICNPPFFGLGLTVSAEGSYMIVDKNLIEIVALAILIAFPTSQILGIDRLMFPISRKSKYSDDQSIEELDLQEFGKNSDRRTLLKGFAGLPFLGAFALAAYKKEQWKSYEERNLVDAYTGASSKSLHLDDVKNLIGKMPCAKIKDIPFSRVILGGNLLSGWAHARDLIYVSHLVNAYHTKDKIFATLLLAEQCGVNTLLTNPILCTLIDEYWKRKIGKIQFISDCAGLDYSKGVKPDPFDKYIDKIKRAIDYGACACYIQGETADYYIENNHMDRLEKAISLIRDSGLPVGIGAHHILTIKTCVEEGFDPDFWMKTLHHHEYWSAKHADWHDNIYCFDPENTIEFMKELKQPWIAFKVLAAGSIHPRDGFHYAFENGADHICVGMYDFQMVNNINVALEILNGEISRKRPWRNQSFFA